MYTCTITILFCTALQHNAVLYYANSSVHNTTWCFSLLYNATNADNTIIKTITSHSDTIMHLRSRKPANFLKSFLEKGHTDINRIAYTGLDLTHCHRRQDNMSQHMPSKGANHITTWHTHNITWRAVAYLDDRKQCIDVYCNHTTGNACGSYSGSQGHSHVTSKSLHSILCNISCSSHDVHCMTYSTLVLVHTICNMPSIVWIQST